MDLNTHETMKFLTDTERDRFVKFQALFESDGWHLLVEYAQAKAAEATQRAALADSWENNRLAVGYRGAWGEISNIENQFMNEFDAIAAERREESDNSTELDDL